MLKLSSLKLVDKDLVVHLMRDDDTKCIVFAITNAAGKMTGGIKIGHSIEMANILYKKVYKTEEFQAEKHYPLFEAIRILMD